jgi:hypothetical protein
VVRKKALVEVDDRATTFQPTKYTIAEVTRSCAMVVDSDPAASWGCASPFAEEIFAA